MIANSAVQSSTDTIQKAILNRDINNDTTKPIL